MTQILGVSCHRGRSEPNERTPEPHTHGMSTVKSPGMLPIVYIGPRRDIHRIMPQVDVGKSKHPSVASSHSQPRRKVASHALRVDPHLPEATAYVPPTAARPGRDRTTDTRHVSVATWTTVGRPRWVTQSHDPSPCQALTSSWRSLV